jgi:hypothetical protein
MVLAPLPCPFCGSHDVHVNGIGQQVVRCMTCRAEGPAVLACDPLVVAAMHARHDEPGARVMRDIAIHWWNRAPRSLRSTITCAACGDEIAVEACRCDRLAEQDEHEAQYLEDRCVCCEEPLPECSCSEPGPGGRVPAGAVA